MSLEELLKRVEEADGPDRELDREIWVACGGEIRGAWKNGTRWLVNGEDVPPSFTELTSSLDAAIGLVERVLPGWGYQVSRYEHGTFGMWSRAYLLVPVNGPGGDTQTCLAPTSPLAVLSALLRALQAKETGE